VSDEIEREGEAEVSMFLDECSGLLSCVDCIFFGFLFYMGWICALVYVFIVFYIAKKGYS
jgi:hypothetical protein